MTHVSVGAGAHNPMIRTEPGELAVLRGKVGELVELCLGGMPMRPNRAGIVDVNTIWPTQVLDILGIDYGPGSDLASQSDEEG